MIDRIVHHADVAALEGTSYCVRNAPRSNVDFRHSGPRGRLDTLILPLSTKRADHCRSGADISAGASFSDVSKATPQLLKEVPCLLITFASSVSRNASAVEFNSGPGRFTF